MMAKGHERGFGFIPNSAIDQHVSERHRERDMEPVVAAHPKLLGIGIDPNTVIVVHEDQFEVLGSGKVTIANEGQKPYSISSRSHFALRKRMRLGRNYDLNRAASWRRTRQSAVHAKQSQRGPLNEGKQT